MFSKDKKAGLFERFDIKKLITKLHDKINCQNEEAFPYLSRSSSEILENDEEVELVGKRFYSEIDLKLAPSDGTDFTLKKYIFNRLQKFRNTNQDNAVDEKETKFLFKSPILRLKSNKNIKRTCAVDEEFVPPKASVIEENDTEMKERRRRRINLIRRMWSGLVTLPKESEDVLCTNIAPKGCNVITGNIKKRPQSESNSSIDKRNITEKEKVEEAEFTADCENNKEMRQESFDFEKHSNEIKLCESKSSDSILRPYPELATHQTPSTSPEISNNSSSSNEKVKSDIKYDLVKEEAAIKKYDSQLSSSSEVELNTCKVTESKLCQQHSVSFSEHSSNSSKGSASCSSSSSNAKKPSLICISKSSRNECDEVGKARSKSVCGNICRFLCSKKNKCPKENACKRNLHENQKKKKGKMSKKELNCEKEIFLEDIKTSNKRMSKESICKKEEVCSSRKLDKEEMKRKPSKTCKVCKKNSKMKSACGKRPSKGHTCKKSSCDKTPKVTCTCGNRKLSKEKLSTTRCYREDEEEDAQATVIKCKPVRDTEDQYKRNKLKVCGRKCPTLGKLLEDSTSPSNSFQYKKKLCEDLSSDELSLPPCLVPNKEQKNKTKKSARIVAPFDSSIYLVQPSYATVVSFRILTAICVLSFIRFMFTVGLIRYGMVAFTVAAAFSVTGLLVSTKNFEKQNSSESLDHYNMTHAFVNALLVPFVAAEMWSLNTYDKYMNSFYALLSLGAVPGYFMTDKEPVQKLTDTMVTLGLIILMAISVLHQNTAGLAAAIIYGVAFLSDDDLLSQIDMDLFLFTNIGRGLFIYLSSMALRGARRDGVVCLCHALHRN